MLKVYNPNVTEFMPTMVHHIVVIKMIHRISGTNGIRQIPSVLNRLIIPSLEVIECNGV
jgi:hypothetical protein